MTRKAAKKTTQRPAASFDESELIGEPGADDPDASELAPADDPHPDPDYVTWWDAVHQRYVGGRHPADQDTPDGVEVREYVTRRTLEAGGKGR